MTNEHNNPLFDDPNEDPYANYEPEGDDYMPDELYTDSGEIIDPVPNAFNPNRFLTKVSGQDYLEVKWRLLWLRTDHPNATIDTTCLTHDPQHASFKATVSIPGRGSASGHGSETPGDFRDYYEKAETKALGRALAALGFGTQFSKDYEFGAEDGRVVDAPIRTQQPQFAVSGSQTQGPTNTYAPPIQRPTGPQNATQMPSNYDQPSTKQINMIRAVSQDLGMTEDDVSNLATAMDMNLMSLTKRQASQLIDQLVQRQNAAKQQ